MEKPKPKPLAKSTAQVSKPKLKSKVEENNYDDLTQEELAQRISELNAKLVKKVGKLKISKVKDESSESDADRDANFNNDDDFSVEPPEEYVPVDAPPPVIEKGQCYHIKRTDNRCTNHTMNKYCWICTKLKQHRGEDNTRPADGTFEPVSLFKTTKQEDADTLPESNDQEYDA